MTPIRMNVEDFEGMDADLEKFEFDLDDGRTAICNEVERAPYVDGYYAAGLAKGVEPDTIYFTIGGLHNYFLRPDEAIRLAWVINEAVFVAMAGKTDEPLDEEGRR